MPGRRVRPDHQGDQAQRRCQQQQEQGRGDPVDRPFEQLTRSTEPGGADPHETGTADLAVPSRPSATSRSLGLTSSSTPSSWSHAAHRRSSWWPIPAHGTTTTASAAVAVDHVQEVVLHPVPHRHGPRLVGGAELVPLHLGQADRHGSEVRPAGPVGLPPTVPDLRAPGPPGPRSGAVAGTPGAAGSARRPRSRTRRRRRAGSSPPAREESGRRPRAAPRSASPTRRWRYRRRHQQDHAGMAYRVLGHPGWPQETATATGQAARTTTKNNGRPTPGVRIAVASSDAAAASVSRATTSQPSPRRVARRGMTKSWWTPEVASAAAGSPRAPVPSSSVIPPPPSGPIGSI